MRTLLAIPMILILSSCGAVGLPRPLTSSDVASLSSAASPLVLAIDPDGNDDIAGELIAILRENRTFREVGFVSELGGRADVVGRLEYEHDPVGAVIPVLSRYPIPETTVEALSWILNDISPRTVEAMRSVVHMPDLF